MVLRRTPQRLLHIFDELYAAKGIEGRDYFRIKLLELFYHIKQLRIEDQYEATYYAEEQIRNYQANPATAYRKPSTKNTYRRTLTKRANEQSHISGYFQTDLWRHPLCAYQNYKMNLAAVYLQETDQSITQIAGELGYSNISKFARAFQEVFGMLPKDYRKVKNQINLWAVLGDCLFIWSS
ncbi:MAG: helix-turn-helix domain-containing protein [Coprococcus sp.]